MSKIARNNAVTDWVRKALQERGMPMKALSGPGPFKIGENTLFRPGAMSTATLGRIVRRLETVKMLDDVEEINLVEAVRQMGYWGSSV